MKALVSLTILALLSGRAFAVGKTLEECFQASLQRSELVASQAELIKQAEENYHQAIGAVLPNLSGQGTYQWQQNANTGNFTTLYPSPASSTKLTLVQPLFEGFKEFAGLRQTRSLISASGYDKQQATTQLYLDTTACYFAVVALEHDIDNVQEELGYYDKRINELHQFKAIGRSQLSELLTAQAQQATLRAQQKQITGQLRAQRAVLAFLTGFDSSTPLNRPEKDDANSKPLADYVSRIAARPDVQGDTERVKAAEEGLPIARAGHLPTLGLQGDYFLERTGALKDVKWDLIVVLSVPIFSGGIVSAQVSQAVSKRDQAELQLSRTKRLALQQIQQYFESYTGDREQFIAFKEAVDLAEKNYKEELREYRLGLVTNLDVLTALTTFQESKRSLDKARYSMLQDVENLEAAGAYKPGR